MLTTATTTSSYYDVLLEKRVMQPMR